MNRFIRFLILGALCAALLVLAGRATLAAKETLPVQDAVAQPPQASQGSNTGNNQLPPMAPGVVLVGLMANVTATVGRVGVQASDASLDATFAHLGVRDVEPVFPNAQRTVVKQIEAAL